MIYAAIPGKYLDLIRFLQNRGSKQGGNRRRIRWRAAPVRRGASSKAETSTAAVMQVVIDEWNLYLRERKPSFEKEEWGWRYWRQLEDTPYTRGEKDLAGWNSQDDNLKGKEAFI